MFGYTKPCRRFACMEALSAEEVFRWATSNGAEFFGIDAGRIAVGAQADAVLLDLAHPKMQPGHNLISDWVYAADSSVIRYTLCAGRIVSSSRSLSSSSRA